MSTERNMIRENLVEAITMRLLGKERDPAPGVDWHSNRTWTVNSVRAAVRGIVDDLQLMRAPDETHATGAELFQEAVGLWLVQCFGREVASDLKERAFRFQEEANELTQAIGMTREEAHALVDYTWNRPVGETTQELGGVLVTLAALCHASGMDMETHALNELSRINQSEVMERIRAKQLTKPHRSPLPGNGSVSETQDSPGATLDSDSTNRGAINCTEIENRYEKHSPSETNG